MNLWQLFKKDKNLQPLPAYGPLATNAIPKASILLFYGGVKLTQWVGNHLYNHPYRPPSFHAAFYCEGDRFLNVGKFRVMQNLSNEFRSTRRVDVLILRDLTSTQRDAVCEFAKMDVSKRKPFSLPDYSWWDFLRFGLPFLKPSKKQFCSENVCLLFEKIGAKVSDLKPENTAPWDLYEYALKHPEAFDIRTVWAGADFKI